MGQQLQRPRTAVFHFLLRSLTQMYQLVMNLLLRGNIACNAQQHAVADPLQGEGRVAHLHPKDTAVPFQTAIFVGACLALCHRFHDMLFDLFAVIRVDHIADTMHLLPELFLRVAIHLVKALIDEQHIHMLPIVEHDRDHTILNILQDRLHLLRQILLDLLRHALLRVIGDHCIEQIPLICLCDRTYAQLQILGFSLCGDLDFTAFLPAVPDRMLYRFKEPCALLRCKIVADTASAKRRSLRDNALELTAILVIDSQHVGFAVGILKDISAAT